jgi:hypothetical protein
MLVASAKWLAGLRRHPIASSNSAPLFEEALSGLLVAVQEHPGSSDAFRFLAGPTPMPAASTKRERS